MKDLRKFGLAFLALAATPALAGPGEPALVVEKLADPDPGFVPPPPEKHPVRAQRRKGDTLDEAFENLGRIAGQAAQMAEQRARADRQKLIDIACRAAADARSRGTDLSAWAKDC